MGVSAPSIIKQDRVNLLNASYAAADTMAQESQRKFSNDRPLVVADLQEIVDIAPQQPIAHPKVGQVLSAQLRDRFTQLGYIVTDETRATGSRFGEVSGTYELKDSRMTVHLRMVDHQTGRIVATHSYSLPITYDIRKYMTRSANSLPLMPPIL